MTNTLEGLQPVFLNHCQNYLRSINGKVLVNPTLRFNCFNCQGRPLLSGDLELRRVNTGGDVGKTCLCEAVRMFPVSK